MNRRVGLYPGSFDPIHNGHLELIDRCAPLFDVLYVAVLRNESKQALFSVEERIEMIGPLVARYANCRVESFSGLLVDFARKIGAGTIVRGLRAVADFDYELKMVSMNRRLESGVETVFLMPTDDTIHLSSSLIKEVCVLGGDISGLVPEPVRELLEAKLASRPQAGPRPAEDPL